MKMKKALSVLFILSLLFCLSAVVYAQEENTADIIVLPDENAISAEDSFPSKAPSAASGVEPNWIRFIPSAIEVSSDKVTVEGYFINMNSSHAVRSFKEFSMDVYRDGSLIVSGEFGTINDFTIEPLGMRFQRFTFNGSHRNHSNGYYTCDDSYYTKTAFRFTSVSR